MRTIQVPYIFLLISTLFVFYSCDAAEGGADRENFQPLPEDYDVAFHAHKFFDYPFSDNRYERRDGDKLIFPVPGFEDEPYVLELTEMGAKGRFITSVHPFYSGYEVVKQGKKSGVKRILDGSMSIPMTSEFQMSSYITANGNLRIKNKVLNNFGVIDVHGDIKVPIEYKSVYWYGSDLILARKDSSLTAYNGRGDTLYRIDPLTGFSAVGDYLLTDEGGVFDKRDGSPVKRPMGPVSVRPQPTATSFSRESPVFGPSPSELLVDVRFQGIFRSWRYEDERPRGRVGSGKYPDKPEQDVYLYTYQDTTYLARPDGIVFQERFIDRDGTGERFIALRHTIRANTMYYPAMTTALEKFIEVRGDSMMRGSNIVDLVPGKRPTFYQMRIFGRRLME